MPSDNQLTENPTRRFPTWAKWAFLLIPIVLIVVLNLMYPSIANQQHVLTGEVGDLLYVAAFDGFNDEWEQYRGQQSAAIENGVMQIEISDAGVAAWSVTRPQFRDFDVRVTARAVDGPENNGFGLILRLQRSEPTCDFDYPLACELSRVSPWFDLVLRRVFNPQATGSTIDYYLFLISSNGFYSVWQAEGGDATEISTWIDSDLINQGIGESNTLRAIASGDTMRFFINDEPVILCIPDDAGAQSTYFNGDCLGGSMQETLSGVTLDYGQLGVVVQTEPRDPNVVVEFDNLIVFSPDE